MNYGVTKKKRADGRYTAWVTENGKRKYFYDANRQALVTKVKEYIEKKEKGYDITELTLAEYSRMFLDKHKAEYSPTTFSEYERTHRNHLSSSEIGNMKMADVRHSDIQLFIMELNLNKKTIRNIVSYIRTLFTDAMADKLLDYNPMSGKFRYPQGKKTQYYIYTPEEMSALFASYDENDIDLLAVMLAALCGMRLSEIMALQGTDVDFDNNTLRVTKAAVSVKNEVVVKPPKTEGSERTIYFPEIVKEKLRYHYRDGYIFSPDGGKTPMIGNYISMHLYRHEKRANLPHTRFHDLRHFSATTLMSAGLPDKQIADYLGHTNTATTRRYQHILKNMQKRPAEVFSLLFPQK